MTSDQLIDGESEATYPFCIAALLVRVSLTPMRASARMAWKTDKAKEKRCTARTP